MIAELADSRRVLAFDNRGGGLSGQPESDYSIEMMADDTAGLMRAVGVGRADVLGISLGGRIALELTVRHPELVQRLVLVSAAARATQPTLILHGRQDRSTPYQRAEELHAGIAGSRLVTFSGGHMFLLQGEGEPFLTTVTAFLD